MVQLLSLSGFTSHVEIYCEYTHSTFFTSTKICKTSTSSLVFLIIKFSLLHGIFFHIRLQTKKTIKETLKLYLKMKSLVSEAYQNNAFTSF